MFVPLVWLVVLVQIASIVTIAIVFSIVNVRSRHC